VGRGSPVKQKKTKNRLLSETVFSRTGILTTIRKASMRMGAAFHYFLSTAITPVTAVLLLH
jgi:hypothetical protein